MTSLSIGQLSRQTETPSPTIRYCEIRGLLPRPSRGTGGQRRYGAADVERLTFIRSRRALGFPLAEVARLLKLTGPGTLPCAEARRVAMAQLDVVQARLMELRATEAALIGQIAACETGCETRTEAECLLLPA